MDKYLFLGYSWIIKLDLFFCFMLGMKYLIRLNGEVSIMLIIIFYFLFGYLLIGFI